MENANKDQSVRPTSAPPEPAKKWYERKMIILLLPLIVLLAIATIKYPNPVHEGVSSTDTERTVQTDSTQIMKWNTYTDNEIGFSMDFPVDWIVGTDKQDEDLSNGGLNLKFYPPENKATDKYGNPHGDPIVYLSWSTNNDPTIDANYEDPIGLRKLSPDKKYFYSLTMGDDYRYSDVFKEMTASLKFIDKKSKDEIVWVEPQKLEDLKIFIPYAPDYINNYYIKLGGRQFEPTYHLVGRINSGRYAGADIISAIFGVDGKSYTILKINGSYKILSKYNDNFGDYDLNNFAIELPTDSAYDISDLDCPDEISPVEGLVFRKTDEPENVFDPNSPETKESLSSKKIGKSLDGKDLYDLSKDGQRQEIGILLPNGTLVFYALKNIKYAEYVPLVDGKTLDDYVTHSFCSGTVWSKQDHGEYYEPTNLKQIGAIYGLPVYEISNADLLKKLYTDMGGGKERPYFTAMKGVSQEVFAASHPLLVWTDPYGRRFPLIDEKFDECQNIQAN